MVMGIICNVQATISATISDGDLLDKLARVDKGNSNIYLMYTKKNVFLVLIKFVPFFKNILFKSNQDFINKLLIVFNNVQGKKGLALIGRIMPIVSKFVK